MASKKKSAKKKSKSVKVNMSAETGRFVSKEYTKQHPSTTITEKVKKK